MESQNDYIEYQKPNAEIYRIRQRASVPPVRNISLWLLIPFLLTLVLGAWLVWTNIVVRTIGQTEYEVKGGVGYQVYLKENDYYREKYLGPNMQYIASLIDTVRLDYDYELAVDEQVDANYEYAIVATAIATDKTNKSRELYRQSDTLKANMITPIENGMIKIADIVNIDYAKYNDYMHEFRSDFGIAANCYLNVELIVKVDGAIKTEDMLTANIPLSDQTIGISISAEGINRTERVGDGRAELHVENMSMAVVGGVIMVVSLIAVGLVVYLYATRFGDNWYAEAEYQIKKRYDSIIIDATSSYYEDGELVRVSDFMELTDASRTEGTPIVRYDVEPEYKSYYVVGSANGLKTYRYTLSRVYQDELRTSGRGKEKFN